MANRVGSEHQSPSRRRYAWWVPYCFWVRYSLGGEHATIAVCLETCRANRLLRPFVSIPPNTQNESASVARGFQIEQRQCAGCHEMSTRSTGPSYQEVVTFYLHHSADPDEKSDLLTRLSSAVAHPQPGWGNFAPGPAESGLSLEDRDCRRELDSEQFRAREICEERCSKVTTLIEQSVLSGRTAERPNLRASFHRLNMA